MSTSQYEKIAENVKDAPLFKGISKEEISHILNCLGAYTREYSRGQYIMLDDEEIKKVGLVMTGHIQMVRDEIDGGKTVLATINKNEVFGESFACGTSLSSTVSFTAITASIVLFLPFRRVLHTCGNNCRFHQKMVENMVTLIAEKNVMLMEKIDIISKKSVREKISAYLAMQSRRQSSRYFDLPLGRVQLGEYLCVDRSALTRELNSMKADGLIDFEKNTFRILKELE